VKTECSIVRDLLPLYVEDMVSAETAQYIKTHLAECSECQRELADLKECGGLITIENKTSENATEAKSFKIIMKRMNRQFYMLAYSLIIFFVFLGFGWTGGENLMYNSIIMPIVGIFGYYVFRWKAVYKMPVLLLLIDLSIFLFQIVELSFVETLEWTLIYCIFVWVGVLIAFLLHFAFRKEDNE
jgi:hypothetical protein